jgi:hypothetical protein
MKFKYIWRENTNVKFEWKKYEVLENWIVDIDCNNDFAEYLIRNHFIEVKMLDETEKEVKIKSKTK